MFQITDDYGAGLPVIGAADLGRYYAAFGAGGAQVAQASGPVGKIVRAVDPNYGAGDFIYLAGPSASNVLLGDLVFFGGTQTLTINGVSTVVPLYQATLDAGTAYQNVPLAVAVGTPPANTQWGWFQMSGCAIMATNGTLTAANLAVYRTGSGQISSTVVAGKQLVNAISLSATGTPSAGYALMEINYPFAQPQIT
jgi:hypothetical protein